MPFFDEATTSYGNDDLFAQEEALALRKAKLLARAQDAARRTGAYAPPTSEAPESVRSAVTGGTILGPRARVSALASAAPLIAGLSDAIAQKGYEEDRSGYKRAERAAADAHMAARPADDAPEAEKLAWMQAGTRIPSLAPTMRAYFEDQIIRAPERQEAREERKATREATVAEAQRRQAEELRYRRERDEQSEQLRRDLAQQGNDLRATIAAASRGSRDSDGGGSTWSRSGVKGSDIKRDVDREGNITLTDIISGEQKFFKGGGKPSSTAEKTAAEAANKQRGAVEGMSILRSMEPLIDKATSSRLGAAVDYAGSIVGKSWPSGDAAGELDQMGKDLVSYIDRSGLGPQFSDADLKFLSQTAGGLGDPTTPASRKRAVYNRVVEKFKRQAGQPTRSAEGVVTEGSEPVEGSTTLRQPSTSKPTVKWGDLK